MTELTQLDENVYRTLKELNANRVVTEMPITMVAESAACSSVEAAESITHLKALGLITEYTIACHKRPRDLVSYYTINADKTVDDN